MITNFTQIPENWVFLNFDDIIMFLTDYQANGSFASLKENVKTYKEKNYAILVRLKDLRHNLEKFENFIYTDMHGFDFLKKSSLKGGEVLVANVGAGVGTTLLMPPINSPATLAPNMFLVFLSKFIEKKYFLNYCKSNDYWREIESVSGGSGQPKMNKKEYRSISIPIPPIEEQKRIVTKIEELLTKLNAGIQELTLAREKLKIYHQSILKQAFEGKLTEKWRKAHKNQLNDFFKVETFINDKRRNNRIKKFKDLSNVTDSEMPNIPTSWLKARIWELSDKIQYGTSEKANNDPSGVPVLRMGNIKEGKLIFDQLKYMPLDWGKKSDFLLENGDLLFNRTNSAELVGKSAVYKSHFPKSVFASYLIRVKLNEEIYNPNFLSLFINSFHGRKYIKSVVSQQVGQANVNGTKLAYMPVPVPTIKEQNALIKKIEEKFSVTDSIETTLKASLKEAIKLRQSILKIAFNGLLVPQEPSDEPVENLLRRIKAEKEKQKTKRNPRKKVKTKTKQKRLL